jgi:putative Holliday junction resolvase
MRYLGIDYGSVRTGLALSDENGVMGFPHKIVATTPRILEEVAELIRKEGVGMIVMGHSLALSGEENPIAGEAHIFADSLAKETGLEVVYESEVFTSAEARRAPEKEEKTRAPKKHVPVDASAAALILTQYLSRSTI